MEVSPKPHAYLTLRAVAAVEWVERDAARPVVAANGAGKPAPVGKADERDGVACES
jgi:hypothetical protein